MSAEGSDPAAWAPASKHDRIGHYACSIAGRLVRVGLIGRPRRKPPASIAVDCPACGRHHPAVAPLWRHPVAADEGRGVELLVEGASLDDEGSAEDDGAIGEAV